MIIVRDRKAGDGIIENHCRGRSVGVRDHRLITISYTLITAVHGSLIILLSCRLIAIASTVELAAVGIVPLTTVARVSLKIEGYRRLNTTRDRRSVVLWDMSLIDSAGKLSRAIHARSMMV